MLGFHLQQETFPKEKRWSLSINTRVGTNMTREQHIVSQCNLGWWFQRWSVSIPEWWSSLTFISDGLKLKPSTVIDEKWNWLGDHRPKGTSCPAKSESGISWLSWPAFCAIPGTTRGHPAIALNELEGERPRRCTEPCWKPGNPPGAAERWENMGEECHQNLIILSHYDQIILNSPVRPSRLSAIDPVRSTNHSQINFCWFRFVWKSCPKTCPKLAQIRKLIMIFPIKTAITGGYPGIADSPFPDTAIATTCAR